MNPPPVARSLLWLAFTLCGLACGRDMAGLGPAIGTGGNAGDGPSAGGTGESADAATTGGAGHGGAGGSTGGAGTGGTAGEPGADAAAVASDTGPSNQSEPDAGTTVADATTPPDGPPAVATCQLPDQLPVTGHYLANIPQSMDFAFDKAGNYVSIDMPTGALLATPYQGTPVTLLKGAAKGFGRGAHFLLDGDLFLIDEGSLLVSVTPQGQKNMLATLEGARGVTLDARARPIISAREGIFRLDGTQLTAISKDPNRAAAVAFSPDYRTLYAATPAGQLRKMAMDADGKAGPQQVFATIPKDGETLIVDDMTVDECGNLFVVNASHQVWRVTPAGQMTKVVETNSALGGPSFGSGRGGWKATSLYVAVPGTTAMKGGALEVDLGFRGAPDPVLSK